VKGGSIAPANKSADVFDAPADPLALRPVVISCPVSVHEEPSYEKASVFFAGLSPPKNSPAV
jgi:hypothetical protein